MKDGPFIFQMVGSTPMSTYPHPLPVCEYVPLSVIPDSVGAFISTFHDAEKIISRQPGYISHRLIQNQSILHDFILLVEWDNVESHTEGFRKSADYLEWKALLHHFYDPFPTVSYYTIVS